MRTGWKLLTTAGTGALLMFLFDPDRGSRRRSLLRDRVVRGGRRTGEFFGAAARDLRHRSEGVAARLQRARFGRETTDDVVVARVRAKLGRFVSHPGAIAVTAQDGRVTLSGPILAHEHQPLLTAIRKVKGLTTLEDGLDTHDEPGSVPGLQGGSVRLGQPYEFMQERWTPGARLVAGAGGAALAAYGLARRDVVGLALAVTGSGIAARGITNLDMRRLTGIGARRRAVDVQKTMDIAAPVEQVYEFWRDFTNFPRFLSHVEDVHLTAEPGQTHWRVRGPGGAPLEYDAILTDFRPNEVIAWKTTEGSAVQHAGFVRFERTGDMSTRLTVRMSYNPPGGAIGHAAAALVGGDLKRTLDEDFVRLKTLLETGNPPHDAGDRFAGWREVRT